MTKELEQKLIDEHPILFKDVNKDMNQSAMAFGCCVRDGWYAILRDLCEYLELLSLRKEFIKKGYSVDYYTIQRPKIVFRQIKEKFGILSVYWGFDEYNEETKKLIESLPESDKNIFDGYWTQINSVVSYAEFLSSKTCEECGAPGRKITRRNWIVTRCAQCETKKNEHWGV